MIRCTGLAPWEFEFPFPGSLTFTLLDSEVRLHSSRYLFALSPSLSRATILLSLAPSLSLYCCLSQVKFHTLCQLWRSDAALFRLEKRCVYCTVYGAWCMVHGCMVYGVWCVVMRRATLPATEREVRRVSLEVLGVEIDYHESQPKIQNPKPKALKWKPKTQNPSRRY